MSYSIILISMYLPVRLTVIVIKDLFKGNGSILRHKLNNKPFFCIKSMLLFKDFLLNQSKLIMDPYKFIFYIICILIIVNVRQYMLISFVPILLEMSQVDLGSIGVTGIISNLNDKYGKGLLLNMVPFGNNPGAGPSNSNNQLNPNSNNPNPNWHNNPNHLPFPSQNTGGGIVTCGAITDNATLDSSNHRHTTGYCNIGLGIIKTHAYKSNVGNEWLEKKLRSRNYTCYAICKTLPVGPWGIVNTDTAAFTRDYRNSDAEIYNLVFKIAQITSAELMGKTIDIKVTSSKGIRISDSGNQEVRYRDIKDNLTLQDKQLLTRCISINPSHYNSIKITPEGNISDDSVISSNVMGFRAINTLNILGNREAYRLQKTNLLGMRGIGSNKISNPELLFKPSPKK
jgi:hypothetical protein